MWTLLYPIYPTLPTYHHMTPPQTLILVNRWVVIFLKAHFCKIFELILQTILKIGANFVFWLNGSKPKGPKVVPSCRADLFWLLWQPLVNKVEVVCCLL